MSWLPLWRGGRVPRKLKKRIDLPAACEIEANGLSPETAIAWTRKRQPKPRRIDKTRLLEAIWAAVRLTDATP